MIYRYLWRPSPFHISLNVNGIHRQHEKSNIDSLAQFLIRENASMTNGKFINNAAGQCGASVTLSPSFDLSIDDVMYRYPAAPTFFPPPSHRTLTVTTLIQHISFRLC